MRILCNYWLDYSFIFFSKFQSLAVETICSCPVVPKHGQMQSTLSMMELKISNTDLNVLRQMLKFSITPR